jgi:3-methylcrotonyl-CoA carboxylase alpha subunit
VEFIAAPDGAFYFMEMNTRQQVEHPVTELITGLDLVEWQLRVAAGEPLPLRQEQLRMDGHAVEARIYAEDPARDFLPSIGRLVHLATPATSADLRIDTGVRQGDEITPYYDPMIAKLIAHGATRSEALGRLRAALAEYQVVGVHTNIEFLQRLVDTPSFAAARVDTSLIERERARLFPAPAAPPEMAWEMAARATFPVAPGDGSPWSAADGWRLGARAARQVSLRWGDEERLVPIAFGVDAAGSQATRVVRVEDHIHVFLDGRQHVFKFVDPYLPPAEPADTRGSLVAPMPGRVLAVLAEVGAQVTRGQPLVVMEAMKMEHTVTAPRAGTVARILCAVGEQLQEGTELLRLAE